jgi:hypothetical protein
LVRAIGRRWDAALGGALEGVACADDNRRLGELDETSLREHCGECLEAVERLCEWAGAVPG